MSYSNISDPQSLVQSKGAKALGLTPGVLYKDEWWFN